MQHLSFLTKTEYLSITSEIGGEHWSPGTIESRWDYHQLTIELLKALDIVDAKAVIEMGTMGVSCVKGSDTIDCNKNWDYPGKKPTYLLDARNIPWPIGDNQYEVFIALRVFQHLIPDQKDCIKEAWRIAKRIIIVVPDTYSHKDFPNSKGVSYSIFVDFLNGIHPNLYLPTELGYLYYWDTTTPSRINLERVMKRFNLNNDQVKPIEAFDNRFERFLKRSYFFIRKLFR